MKKIKKTDSAFEKDGEMPQRAIVHAHKQGRAHLTSVVCITIANYI